MTGESRMQRSFVLVSGRESVTTEVKRALGPYRRVQCARDAEEARTSFERDGTPLGVLVEMDLGTGDSGFEVLRDLRERHPYVPALLLAAAPSADEIERGYRLHAAHVPLPLEPDALMPFLFRALTEEVVNDERVGFLVESLASVLTPRETELLVLVISDTPREQILERMAISENTLKGHIRGLLRKLEADDLDKLTARVFRVALQHGGRAASPPQRADEADETERRRRDGAATPDSDDRKRTG